MPACPESFLLLPIINALLLVKNVIKPVGWAISHQKDPNYEPVCHFEFWGRPLGVDFYCDVNPRTAKQTGEQKGSASHKNGLERLDVSSIFSADKPLHRSIFILLCQ